MALRWITSLFVLLLSTLVTGNLLSDSEVEVNTSKTLYCPVSAPFIEKTWFFGYSNDSLNGTAVTAMFTHIGGLNIQTRSPLPGWEVDARNFSISTQYLSLQDDGFFTCKIVTRGMGVQYIHNRVRVYEQPVVTLLGIESVVYTDDYNVTVTCLVDRVYPALPPGGLLMTWGGASIPSLPATQQNPDGTWRYSVQVTRRITKQDRGTRVNCTVLPERGTAESVQETIQTTVIPAEARNTREPEGVKEGPKPTDTTLQVVIPSIVLAALFITATVFLYKRLKSPINEKGITENHGIYEDINQNTHEIRQGPQGRHDMGTDNVAMDDGGYLPGYLYHVYDKVHDAPRTEVEGSSNQNTGTERPVIIPIFHHYLTPPCMQDNNGMQTIEPENEVNASETITFEDLMTRCSISQSTVDKLLNEGITTINDLKLLKESDLKELGVTIGERNRLRALLERLKITDI